MDEIDNELKELLDLELDMSGVIVSEDLIRKTLKRVEDNVIAGQTKKPLFMKWQLRGLISVAALFLIVYMGYNIIKSTAGYKLDSGNSTQAKNEDSVMRNNSKSISMEANDLDGYAGGAPDGNVNNAGNAGDIMNDTIDESSLITNIPEMAATDTSIDDSINNEAEQDASLEIKEAKGDGELGYTMSDNGVYRYAHNALSEYLTEEDMKLAKKSGSDESALAAVIKKAEAGEKITIACIGGSITQGAISNGTTDNEVGFKKSYADIFFEWWSVTFPNTEIEFINAGIGATDSYLGVHRVSEDVLNYYPDLVLVEFSVNDLDNITYLNYYDNLIRKILLSENNPAVMLLFMAQTNLSSAQNSHITVGYNYALPMLSYRDVIKAMMEDERFTKEQLSKDVTHPSALGHAIAGEMIWKYLNSIYDNLNTYNEPEQFKNDALTNERYLTSEILDSEDIVPDEWGSFVKSSRFSYYPNSWTTTEGSKEITFTITCRNLGILYYCTTDGLSGQFEVYIDGKRSVVLDADFSGGWGDYAKALEVYSSDEAKKHTVTIKKAEMSKGDVFTILGFLVSY